MTDPLSNTVRIITDVLVQREALDAASSGNPLGVVIVLDYVALLVASIVALAVIIERVVRLRRSRLIDAKLIASLPDKVRDGDMEGAIALCDKSTSLVGPILSTELKEHKSEAVPMEEAMEGAGEAVEEKVFANLDILGTVARVAPLLGLLGTVLGMMYAFGQLDVGMRKETLAQGITAALDTTVRGLIIAISCLTLERSLHRRIDKALRDYSALFTRLVRVVRSKQGNRGV